MTRLDERGLAAVGYWKRYLDGAPPLMEVITDRHRTGKTALNSEGGEVKVALPPSVVEAARTMGVSEHSFLCCGLKVLVAKYSRAEDVVIGVGRRGGYLPGRLDSYAAPGASFGEIAKKYDKEKEDMIRHGELPWEVLMSELSDGAANYTPVFQVVFLAGDEKNPRSGFEGCKEDFNGTVQYDLEVRVDEMRSEASFLFRTSIFNELTVKRMAEHYVVLLDAAAAKPMLKWSQLTLCSAEEKQKVIYDLNSTSAPYPSTKCIHDLFEDQAIENPNAPCLTYHEPSTMLWLTLSYAELYCRCHSMYMQLRRLGVGPDTPVPILIDRSMHQVVAIYGTLLAGGCYVPIDPDYPSDRVLHMIQDAKASVVITTGGLEGKIPVEFKGTKLLAETITPDQIDVPTAAMRRRSEVVQSPDTNVYIFYTSGTTGLPKGVEVTHRGLVKRAQWLQDFYPLTPEDKMIYKTPFTFGISEWELFWPIPYGAQVVVTKEGGQKDPEYLIQVTTTQKITVCTYVPSMLAMLLEYMISESLNYRTDMRHVICCGEALPVETCYKFFECFDPDVTRLHNLYGPTEADMTYWECPKLQPGTDIVLSKIPIGKPMLNVKVFILDVHGDPVPAGVPGELHFGGVTTAKGYLNLPELTSEKFVRNPYKELGDCDRMYKTGDCARWMPDMSTLEFLGRVDHQVKLRGFRIELGEIESVIGSCKNVNKVAVIVDGVAAAARLVAYVEPKSIEPRDLLKTLKEKVPEYMVPSVIMPLKELPLTGRGKLDRKALPAPPKGSQSVAEVEEGEKLYAETGNEKIVESVWQRILNRTEPIDVNTNFLTLGGNSLLAGRVTTLVRKETGSMIPSTAMYQHPTISKIAALCDKHKPDESGNQGPVIAGNKYKRWGGHSSTTWKVMVFHGVGLLVDSFASTAAFLPGFMYLFSIYYSEGKWEALRLAPLILTLTMLAVCFYTVTLKSIFLGKVKPGEYPVWGAFYLRWWLINNLHKASVKMISPYVEDTLLYNKYLTMMGAVIGDRVSLGTDDIFDPDLITIEDDVTVERKATIIPHSIENGTLTLWPIHINQHCRVLPVGWVTQGTRLPPGSEVGPLSTTGLSARDIRKGSRLWSGISNSQNAARIALIPVILLMEVAAFIPALLFLEWLWETGLSGYPNESNLKYCVFYMCIPWVEKLVCAEVFFLMVAAYKWVFIGKFKPGKKKPGSDFSMDLRKWFLERLTHHQQYRFATQPWINTELLAVKYRVMGVQMGFKVQTDYIEILEFDLLSVGRDSVFGSNVCVNPSDHHESRKIVMKKGSQVLDHSTLMPGCVVGQGALCGSSTVGSKFYKFPDLSISTGNQQGKPVQLRILSGDPGDEASLSHLPPVERDMAIQALRNHQNNVTWGMFNMFNILTVMLIAPLPAVADLLTILMWIWMEQFELFQSEDSYSVALSWILTILITPPAYCVVQILETFLFVGFKWAVVGQYKEGSFPFYGPYHRKWVIMMAVKEAIGKLLDDIGGTPFIIWFFRAMGSKVGKDVCMLGYGLEYDLFSCGDYCSVGVKCDVTCHTVENMVIKLAKTTLKDKATMRAGALVQPGGFILDGGVVMENSQVLKGGEVGEDQVYAGLPAEPVQRTAPELAGTQPSSTPLLFSARRADLKPYFYILSFLLLMWAVPSSFSSHSRHTEASEDVKIRLPEGIIRGEPFYDSYNSIQGYAFAGLPYAEPPTGPRRWAAPVSYGNSWSGVRESRRRPGCADPTGGSEDCLYLDVDVPVDAVGGKGLLPVVVWLHGGCGSYSRPDGHNGKAIVTSMPDAIVVTPSYRVGLLGYFHHKELPHGLNFGLLDQRMALTWVQTHIRSFGGDPTKVTLFGQSTGAGSVALHLTSPPSYGLFHRAVLQSPPASAFTSKSYDTAEAQTAGILSELEKIGSCPGGDLKCLRELRGMALFSTGGQLFQCKEGKEGCSGAAWSTCGEQPCAYGPIIDGKDIKDHPWRLIESGQHAKVPIVIGYRLDDGLRSMNHYSQPSDSASQQQWREWAETAFYPVPEAVVSTHYLSDNFADRAANSNRSASWHAALAARTDQLYGCGVRRVADAFSRTVPTFTYLCTVPMYQGVHSHLWFNPDTKPTKAPTVFEQAFLSQLQGYMATFVAAGDPGAGDGSSTVTLEQIRWDKYTKENPLTAQLHVPVSTVQFPARDACASAWDEHWNGMTACISKL